jgi:hypothetical protein
VRGQEWQQEAMIQHDPCTWLSLLLSWTGREQLSPVRMRVCGGFFSPLCWTSSSIEASSSIKARKIVVQHRGEKCDSAIRRIDAAHGAVAFHRGWWTRSWAWLSERGSHSVATHSLRFRTSASCELGSLFYFPLAQVRGRHLMWFARGFRASIHTRYKL